MIGPEALDELYAGDPADFVERRKLLVRQLKERGDAGLAATVSAAKKPPRTAAALSGVARTDPGLIEVLLDSASAVGAAFRTGGAALRAAQSEYNEAVDAVLDRAVEQTGITAATMSERMRATLLAAGAEPEGEVARQLRVGALRDDAAAPGFSFGLVGSLGGRHDENADHELPDAEEPRERPERRRLRSVRTGPDSSPATPEDALDNNADDSADDTAAALHTAQARDTAQAPDAASDDVESGEAESGEAESGEAAELDASLAERQRLAEERAESDRVATARREAMRRRRGLERELARLERRVSRLTEAANEAEARAHVARSAADEASEELDSLQSRISDLEVD